MEALIPPKRYTLAEAHQILLYREHARDGHEWQEFYAGSKLVSMVCACGVKAEITHPDLPEGVQQ